MRKVFFAALATAVTIPAIVIPVQVQATEVANTNVVDFKDVSKNHYAYTEIMEMKKAGIINGYEDGIFKPQQGISRQHVAALISRALPLEPIREATTFKDVPTSHPYYNEIQRLYRAGIVDGTNGNFNPTESLTRAQMAKILCLAFDLEPQKGYIFTDVGAEHWAKDYIATLYASGITTGSNGKYNGSETVTRAQYAVFLYRALNPDKAPIPEKPLSPEPIKPSEPTKPEPKPEPKPTGKSPIKYSEWSNGDIKTKIPRPNGYVAGEHEKKNEEIVKGIVAQNGHGYSASFFIQKKAYEENYASLPKEYREGVPATFEDKLRTSAEQVGTTYEKFVNIVNHVIETGEVYNGETFTVYFNYQNGMIYMSGVRNN